MQEPIRPAAIEDIAIDVDVKRALDVLSGNVFSGQKACLRELIANASDSISQLPLQAQGNVEIRLQPRRVEGSLAISDNGVGMSRAEAAARLGTLFSTSKASRSDAIGQFGIGFYSCFPLCSRVEVFTRSRQSDDPGTRLTYEGGVSLRLETAGLDRSGTTIVLHLRSEHRALLEDQVLTELVTRDCDFIPYPIYLGSGFTVLNRLDAPWYHREATESRIREGLLAIFGLKEPLAVLPLWAAGERRGICGVLYVAPRSESPTVRLYSHRVLITDSGSDLLPESLRPWLSAVVDAENLPLVLGRDAVLAEAPETQALSELLVDRLASGLASLGRSHRADFRKLMSQHGRDLKAACLEERALLSALRDHIGFSSSLRPFVTIPDYLAARPAGDRTVIYAEDLSLGASLVPLYSQANVEVLYMTDPMDLQLQEAWTGESHRAAFQRLDVDPPGCPAAETEARGAGVERASLEALRLLFRGAVDERLQVELRVLGVEAPAAVLAVSDQDRKILRAVEELRRYEKEGRLDELPPEVRGPAREGVVEVMERMTTQTVLLNASNGVVENLLARLRGGQSVATRGALLPEVARFLHAQALLASGLPLSSEGLSRISRQQTLLLTTLLQQFPD